MIIVRVYMPRLTRDFERMTEAVRRHVEKDGMSGHIIEFAQEGKMRTPFGKLTGMEISRLNQSGQRHLDDWARSVITDAICLASIDQHHREKDRDPRADDPAGAW